MRHLGWMFAGAVVAVALLPGSAAAAFIYSCLPAQGASTGNTTVLFLNNPQVVTANVTVKVQASTGANLNATLSPAVTQNFTIAAGNTKSIRWAQPACTGFCDDYSQGTNATTVPANVRVVSDVELGVGINVQISGQGNLYQCNQSSG